ncbi:flagellar FliJ family protein [Tabrizicola sp.]|uniref:flagellar FliJ family protein n=1 Tax=Tabrizicola sp. TaxID=2005166 RepID=UPI0035B3E197
MRRRLATLATLARLDDQRMRAAAAELLPLQDRMARLAAETEVLERRRQEESQVTEVAALPYLGRFLATLRRETDRIAAEIAATAQVAEQKREAVLEAWRDLRPKEGLQARLIDRARQDLLRAEQAAADERGAQDHAREALTRRRALRG